jgi:20S proteasome subunit alpha 2
LIDEESYSKVVNLSTSIGTVYSGLSTDFRALCKEGRKTSQVYSLQYQEPIYVNTLCREIATTVQEATISGGVRPYGISMLIAGYDDDGP